jgi:hypothetical protein
MFTDNKYYHTYIKVIEKAKASKRNKDICYESHHIIPKSCGGSNAKDNLVFLTLKEHFVCHWLLTKCMIDERNRQRMLKALGSMVMGRPLSSLEYTKAREASRLGRIGVARPEQSKFMLENNPFKGKIHSAESKKKYLESRRSYVGEDNPNFGKIASEETKRKMSAVHKGKKLPIHMIDSLSRTFKVVSPDGQIFEGKNITQFCKQYNLDRGTLSKVVDGKYKQHKGWTAPQKEYENL